MSRPFFGPHENYFRCGYCLKGEVEVRWIKMHIQDGEAGRAKGGRHRERGDLPTRAPGSPASIDSTPATCWLHWETRRRIVPALEFHDSVDLLFYCDPPTIFFPPFSVVFLSRVLTSSRSWSQFLLFSHLDHGPALPLSRFLCHTL